MCQASLYFVRSLLHRYVISAGMARGANVAALIGIRPDGGAGCKGIHGHAFVHIHAHKPAHKHTHPLTHAGTHPLHVSVLLKQVS